MGEAKRRGNYQERVAQAVEREQSTLNSRQMQSQIEMQEHLQRLQARRAQMESQMGPMDKLYVDQKQMIHQAAERLKQMEGVQVIAETDEATVVSIASPISLGTPIEGEVLSTDSTLLDKSLQDGITASELPTIIVSPEPVLSPALDSSHFDDLAPIVNESQT